MGLLQIAGVALLLAVPFVAPSSYVMDVLIVTAMYIGLALSYDLVVGYVGSLSLAHPAFFGIGAYSVALLSTRLGWPTIPSFAAAVAVAGSLAVAVGIPSFRLSQYSFAIGTLGFATVAQLLAQNWIGLTEGPMCVTRIPKASIGIPFDTVSTFYYLVLATVIGVLLFVRQVVRSRIGRSFVAIRENEPLAAAVGVGPLKYKLIAFALSAGLAGAMGGIYASYINVVCPSEVSLYITINLLVILFIGGSASLRGIVLGAILVTTIPEVLRIATTWRLVLYGVVLLLIINFFPEGIEGGLRRLERRFHRAPSR